MDINKNVDIIKTEDDVDVLGEEDSTGMIPDEFYVPSAFSTVKTEPKSPLNEHQLMHELSTETSLEIQLRASLILSDIGYFNVVPNGQTARTGEVGPHYSSP
ncbi:uncharacterized protein LOC110830222 isoform X2 [Zootermopsis nevadensis]|uniref:uncharacterized protein LOC110830222 isoform X2 n=1 Tax=Zootermopsis nevadensis TaxID=136037 RepID=UPI000B8EA2E1|nr:uncharacterized protein LOC110830222 isoform X2 [Zootermopsis nevadensis]